LLRGGELPANANLPLLRRWQEVTSSGMPVLVLRSHNREDLGSAARVGFDYLGYGLKLAGLRHKITVTVVQDANHLFADRRTREAVLGHTERWLNSAFAPVEKIESRSSLKKGEESKNAINV
jgi:hypothetical protein